MSNDVRIYHNPRCSKSRATLALLQQRGLDPVVIDYLETPPSADELTRMLGQLGCSARQLLRTSETEYAELGLGQGDWTDEQIVGAMVTHPRLIERPIVVVDGKAALGRPPEAVLAII
jgi:arsenate reductase